MKIGKTKPTIESSTETVLEHTVLVAESVSMQLPEALRKDYEIVGTWSNPEELENKNNPNQPNGVFK